MAKKKDDYLSIEAQKIGFRKMISDIEMLLNKDLSEAQKIALYDQQKKIKEMLNAL